MIRLGNVHGGELSKVAERNDANEKRLLAWRVRWAIYQEEQSKSLRPVNHSEVRLHREH